MTTQIPKSGYSLMLDAANSGFMDRYIQLSMAGVVGLIVTLICQYHRLQR
jgi:hypothetical protein